MHVAAEGHLGLVKLLLRWAPDKVCTVPYLRCLAFIETFV